MGASTAADEKLRMPCLGSEHGRDRPAVVTRNTGIGCAESLRRPTQCIKGRSVTCPHSPRLPTQVGGRFLGCNDVGATEPEAPGPIHGASAKNDLQRGYGVGSTQ